MSEHDIVEQFVAECEEDHVGLWRLVRAVQEDLAVGEPEQVRAATLKLVHALLEQPGMQIGIPAPDGISFVPWNVNPDVAANEVGKRWLELGRNPDIGEIAWFNLAHKSVSPAASTASSKMS